MEAKVAELKASRFKQMDLRAWRPVQSFLQTTLIFFIFGAVFLGLGIMLQLKSNEIIETTYRYDNTCDQAGPGQVCTKQITIDKDIPAPVYVSYELGNFYQNHRRYVKSRSYQQLMGEPIDTDQANTQCDPVVTNSQMSRNTSFNGLPLDPDAVAYPCGLIAKSLFNDTYVFSSPADPFFLKPYTIDSNNIAWKTDVEYKYAN